MNEYNKQKDDRNKPPEFLLVISAGCWKVGKLFIKITDEIYLLHIY